MGVAHVVAATFAALVLLGLGAAPVVAQVEEPVFTQHEIRIGGRPLVYTAEAGRIPIRDAETGEAHGWIFFVAYRVGSPGKPRPITFVWNGGPGANASLLHIEALGPRRTEAGKLIDNADTWLTDTDLVFVDPIGTGYSRPAKAAYGAEFYNTAGDVMSVTEFVRAWRLLHQAQATPLYLAGESWGGGRAASVAYQLLKRHVTVDGMVLLSGGSGLIELRENAGLQRALRIVDLSATAFFQGKSNPSLGRELPTLHVAAETWARGTYAPALANPSSLSEIERSAVVEKLSGFTGLAKDQIDRKTVSFTPRQYLTGLLKDQGKTLNVFDMRLTGPGPADGGPIVPYLRGELGYVTDLPYVGAEPLSYGYFPNGKAPEAVGNRWVYATVPVTPEAMEAAKTEASQRGGGPPSIGPPLPGSAEAIALNPKLKVLVAAGRYDSLNSCTANEEIARRLAPALKTAIRFKCYVGGHMVYRDPLARSQLARDVKAMIAEQR